MKHPASRRRYRWDDPAPPTLVVGAARTGWSKALRRTITLPKIAAALVGVVSIATIGGLVFIIASSLPTRGNLSVAQAETGQGETAVASINADPAPAVAIGKPAPVAAPTAAKSARRTSETTPAAKVASDMTATVRPRTVPVGGTADTAPVSAYADSKSPPSGAVAAVAAIAEQTPAPKAAKAADKPEAKSDESGRQRLALAVPERPKADAPSSGGNAIVNSPVNMRRTAKGEVMMVIPAGAKVSLSGKCDHWCKVTYDGQTGFVYRSFIRR